MRFPRWAYVGSAVVWGVTVLATAAVYARLPDPMVTHWGPGGAADGFLPRGWGAWLLPGMMAALGVLYWGLVPALEPWRANLQRFVRAYAAVGVGLLLFLALLQGWVLAWNLGWRGDIRRFLGLAFAGLNAGLAWALPQARPNWFFGLRTPWTLSSPRVWHEVHRGTAGVFGLAAGLSLGAVVWPPLLMVAVAWMVVGSWGLVAYSWWLYRRYAAAEP